MSQYHPPPAFGTSFNPNGQFTPAPNAPYQNVSNFLYYQTPDPNHQRRAHQPAPYANTYPFNANSQNMNLSLPRPGIPQIPYSGFGQTTSGSFPPPPYPSIQPLPYSAFPPPPLNPAPPSLFQRETHSASMQANPGLPLKPPPVAVPTKQRITNEPSISTAGINELEDGELSDGERGGGSRGAPDPVISDGSGPPDREREEIFGGSSNQNVEKKMVAQSPLYRGSQQVNYLHSSTGTKDSPNGDKSNYPGQNNSNIEYKESVVVERTLSTQFQAEGDVEGVLPVGSSVATALREGVTVPTQSSYVGPMGISRPTPLAEDHNGMPTEKVNGGGSYVDVFSPACSQESRIGLRQRAKDSLAQLYTLKIGFPELVREGIEPKLLAELYAEIGIEIPSAVPEYEKSKEEEQICSAKGSIARDHMESLPISGRALQIPGHQGNLNDTPEDHVLESLPTPQEPPISGNTRNDIDQSPSLSKEVNIPKIPVPKEPNTRMSYPIGTQSSSSNSKPAPSSKLAKVPTTAILGKSIARSGEKSLERKDYIARMLAAKAGRPIPALVTSPTTDNGADEPKEILRKPASPRQGQCDNADDEQRLLIGNLSYRATESDVEGFFSAFPIKSIHIPVNPSSRVPLGHCYVVLMHPSDTQRAISELSGKKLAGRKVSVKSVHTTEVAESSTESSNSKPEQGPESKGEAKSDSKKIAQTELALQKMEALKARGNIPRDASHHPTLSDNQNQAVSANSQTVVVWSGQSEGVPATHVEDSKVSTLAPASSSKKAVFNIPGLFMEPMAHELVGPTHQPTHQNQSGVPQIKAQTLASVQQGTRATVTEILKEAPTLSMTPVEMKEQTLTATHRKRHKAADFIDSPSVRVRRSLGHLEDRSVIIEVSEDEHNENSGEEMDIDVDVDIDIDEDQRQATSQQQSPGIQVDRKSPGIQVDRNKARSIKDQSSLSEISTRKPVTPRMLDKTPPKVLTPNRSKEPQVLEIEISLMNRKIAEMQQRIIAKQNASRAQTPDKLGNPGKNAGLSVVTQGQHKPNISSTEVVNTVETRIDVQNWKHDANTTQATKEAHVALVIGKAKAEDAEAPKVAEQERMLAEEHDKALEQAKFDAERLRAAEAAQTAEEERRRARRTEIEAGIPVLDAEMERAKQKLHLLRKQMEDLEIEVQKGVEGRRILLEELTGLSDISSMEMPQANLDGSVSSLLGAVREARREPTSPAMSTGVGGSPKIPNVPENDGKPSATSPPQPVSPRRPTGVANAELSANEQQQSSRDRQTNPTDPRTSNRVSIAPASAIPAIKSPVGTEADYEPPMMPDVVEASSPDNLTQIVKHDVHLRQIGPPDTVEGILPPADDLHVQPMELDIIDNDPEENDLHETASGLDRSLPLADPNDSDDYEPPEPSCTVEPSKLPSKLVIFEPESLLPSSSMSDLESPSKLMDVIPKVPVNGEQSVAPAELEGPVQQKDKNTLTKLETNYYIPYESPLKKFKSYRYHPEYLQEVPQGFRSLTYSHGIDSNKFLCQKETAGGTCNDDSCEDQHVRSMGLSDNMILVQMGAIPEGLSQEDGDTYANGLRQIIQEIRGRKVRDFNVVASEITAYRAKFLGDKVKVLPL